MRFKALFAAVGLLLSASAALGQGTQFPAGTLWGNDTAAQRPGKVSTVTAILDRALGTTRGAIIERGAAGWGLIGPGTVGFPFVSAGAGADPAYQRLGLVGGGTNADLSATGGTSQFLRQNSAGAAITVVQPAFTDISGRNTLAQLPQGIANSIFINPTGSTADMQNVAVPACANDGAHALVYINGTGLQCATITAGSGTVTSVVCDGVTITATGTCPPRYGYTNATLAVSAAANALTIALKDNAGSDPSATSPATFVFRNATGTTGSWSQVSATGAMSLVVSSGSTLSAPTSGAFRIWVVMFNDGGTLRLGVINCGLLTGGVTALNEGVPTSSTAEGGAGGADSAGVFYTGTAVTSKSFIILGYVEWGTSGLTAGSWTTTNLNFVQSFGPGIKKPGDVLQRVSATTTTLTTTTSSTFQNSNVTATISLSSAANYVEGRANAGLTTANSSASAVIGSVHRGATDLAVQMANFGAAAGTSLAPGTWIFTDAPNTTSATVYMVKLKNQDGVTSVTLGNGASSVVYGVMQLEEVMR